jgi:galactitol-specific phosphotransferase system IIB component
MDDKAVKKGHDYAYHQDQAERYDEVNKHSNNVHIVISIHTLTTGLRPNFLEESCTIP